MMNRPTPPIQVAVLMGGPDPEREVSIASGSRVAEALRADPQFEVSDHKIDHPNKDELSDMGADVFFPVLHGPFGEGGPLQEILESTGTAFVGSDSEASATGMDKCKTKRRCVSAGIPTLEWIELQPGMDCTIPFPLVVKPVDEGSSIGVRICRNDSDLTKARLELQKTHGRLMAERLASGRELTIGIALEKSLPLIEIVPKSGCYDYEAKYERDDTAYVFEPKLPPGVKDDCHRHALKLWHEIGARDVARVDFMLDEKDECWVLEINTMPGFTEHSLVPKAARYDGIDMTTLCGSLVRAALERHDRIEAEKLARS
jgi:D-alanine-D-alanine ligase